MDLTLLSKVGTVETFKPHDFICIENDLGKQMYILLRGKVGVYLNSFLDNALEIARLEAGSFFGEMSLLEDMARSATIIALDEGATVITIEKEHFHELLTVQKEISFRIKGSLLDRCNRMIEQLSNKHKNKADAYKNHSDYKRIRAWDEHTFYKIVEQEPEQIFKGIKYLSNTIRKINEEILGAEQDKKPDLLVQELAKLEVIPQAHKYYNFKIEGNIEENTVERELKCPICDHTFNQLQTRFSKIRLKAIQNDLRRVYEAIDPVWFNIGTCPHCLYSNYINHFNHLAPKYIEQVKERLKEVEDLRVMIQKDTLDINRIFSQYYLTLICSVERYMREFKKGKIWLNLSWLYKDVEDEKMYEYASIKAFEHYHQGYLKASYRMEDIDEQSLFMVLGELYFRQKKYESARKLFFEVTQIKNGDVKLVHMAVERSREMKKLMQSS